MHIYVQVNQGWFVVDRSVWVGGRVEVGCSPDTYE